jgi:predicted nuclease of predicted toxin-antitoxin system
MAKFLANENVPAAAVEAARLAGHDLSWIAESALGSDDDAVLAQSLAEGRVLITFDKDFGKLAFRLGRRASCGIILFRPKLRSPDYLSQFVSAGLSQSVVWEEHFSVATVGRLRVIPLHK